DLARDVEIIGFGFETRRNQRVGGRRERPGTVQHGIELLKSVLDNRWMVETEHAIVEVAVGRLAFERFGAPTRERRCRSLFVCGFGDERAGIAIRAVDQQVPLHAPRWTVAGKSPG